MNNTFRLTLSAMLLGIMLILGFIESTLPPIGIQGIKLGLSNGVLIFALYMLDLPTAWILMALKVVLSGFLFGGVNAMFYAFAGGVLSLAGMSLMSRVPKMPAVAVSVLGGILHNMGQLAMAMLIAQLPMQFLVYVLILVGSGAVSGALTGTAAALVMRHLKAGGFRMAKVAGKGNRIAAAAAAAIVLGAGLLSWHYVKPDLKMADPGGEAGSAESAESVETIYRKWTREDFLKYMQH